MYNFIIYDFFKINRKKTNRSIGLSATCLLFFVGHFGIAQNVTIPDANFKAYLVGNTAINTNGDGEIQVSEAQAFTGTISCGFLDISDLTGIEAFVNIKSLFCNNNFLTALDLSNNTALETLSCGFNGLSTLNISNNTALISLNCFLNNLTTLDVSNNTNLTSLACGDNNLTVLDVSNNTALVTLDCLGNSLTTLDVNNNTSLEVLNFGMNLLTTINISNNVALTELWCAGNQLTALDLNNTTALKRLYCYNNQLTFLDLSNNTSLNIVQCNNNQLDGLNLKNGNNISITQLRTQNNPDLTCIHVDDSAYSNANWTGNSFQKDVNATFSENCAYSIDDFFVPTNISVYPNPVNDVLNIKSDLNLIENVKIYDIKGGLLYESSNKNKEINVNVSDFSNGIYFVKTTIDDGISKTIKVMKR